MDRQGVDKRPKGCGRRMIGEFVEKLSIANIKLYEVCDKKADIVKDPSKYSKDEIVEVLRKDIELCKQRAMLKNAIDNKISQAIMSGSSSVVNEVKNYGSS